MKPSPSNRFFLLSVCTLTAFAHAGSLTWDGNAGTAPNPNGGSGTWNTSTSNWWNGTANVVWPVAGTDNDALFANNAGTITLGTAITANDLTFTTTDYILSGAQTLTLNGTTPTIQTGNGVSTTIGNNTATVIAGSSGLTKAGAGTLILNGSSANTFTGGLTLKGGTLNLNYGNLATPTDLIQSGNTLALSGGNLVITAKTGGGVATSQTLGNTSVNSGGGSILINPNNSDGVTLNLGSLSATAAGGSLLIGKAITANTGTVTVTTTTDKDAQGIYGGRIIFANGTANTGYDFATTSSGSSPFTLSAFSGYTTMVAGATSDALNHRVTGNLTLSGAHTHNSLKIENPAASQTLALGSNLLTLNSGGLLVTGTNAFTISGTAGGTRLTAGNGSGAYDLIVHQYNSGGLTISAVIGNNGANPTSLTKAGTGTLTLSGINTYTGKTYINSGILSIAADTGLGTAPGAAVADQLNLNGGTLKVTANSVTLAANRGITLGSSAGTLDFSGRGSGESLLVSGIIAGTGALNLKSSGDMSANGGGASGAGLKLNNAANTFTGDVSITSGLVTYTNNASFGNAANKIVLNGGGLLDQNSNIALSRNIEVLGGGGTFRMWGSVNVTWSGAISGSGNINRTDGGTLTLSGNLSGYSGTYNNQGGNTTLTGTATTIGGNWTLSAATLTVNSTANQALAGTISGASTFTKNAAGILTLSGPNTHTGTVNISGGTLKAGVASVANVSGAFGNNSSIVFANTAGAVMDITGFNTQVGSLAGGGTTGGNTTLGAATLTTGGNNSSTSYSGAISGTGNLIKIGTGTQILGGTNTFTGTTTVSAGMLQYAKQTSLYNNTPANWTAAKITVSPAATLALNVGGSGEFTTSDLTTISGLGTGIGGFTNGSFLGLDTTNASGGNFTYSGILANPNAGANVLGLNKLGTNILTLAGANTYTGATTVTAGTLNITGSVTSAINVNSGALLSGSGGSTSSTLNLNAGSSIVGVTSVAGTGNAFLASGAITTGASVFILGHDGDATPGSHSIDVLRYSSSPGLGNFSTAKYHAGASLFDDTANSKITLTYSSANRTWNMPGTSTWDAMGTAAWQEGDQKYADGDAVTFNDTGFGTGIPRTVTLNSVVSPGSLTFNTEVTAHTISGTGSISGSTSLLKSGAAQLTLSTANTFSGGTTINGGQLQVRNNNALGSGAVTVNSGAILSFGPSGMNVANNVTLDGGTLSGGMDSGTINNTYSGTLTLGAGGGILTTSWSDKTLTVAGQITGSGNLTIDRLLPANNAPNIILTGNNNYTGTTTLTAGTLFVGNGGTTGSLGTGNVVNNGTLYFNRTGSHSVSNDISGTGGLTFSTASASSPNLSGTLNVGSILIQNQSTVTFSGSTANTTGNVTIDSSGSGNISTLILGKTANTVALSGNVTLGHYGGSGRLQLAASEQIADTSTVILNAGGLYGNNAVFSLMGYDETIGWLQGTGSRAANTVQNGGATDSVLTLAGNGLSKTASNGGSGGSFTIQNGSGGGILSIVKNGTGTQVFSKGGNVFNATYTGTTTINAGTLSLDGVNFNSSATVLAGGTFNLTTSTVNAAISGTSGLVTVTGGTTSNLGGGNKTYSVDTLVSGASTILTQTAANSLSANSLHTIGTGATLNTGNFAGTVKALTGSGSVVLGTNTSANLIIADGLDQIFTGNISGLGTLTKAGSGIQTLTGTNSYTGGTLVTGGTLIGTRTSSLGTNSGLTLNGGHFAYQPTAAGALNVGSGVLNFADGSRIGTALGGTLSQSAITSTGAAVTAGNIIIDIFGIPGVAPTDGSNDLITAASGLNGASYTLGKVYNTTNFTVSGLSASGTAVSITTTNATALTTEYWKGGFSGGNNVWAISDGSTNSNWTTDAGGTTATSLTPGTTAVVNLSATGASNQNAMVLGANMSVAGIVVGDTNPVGLNVDGNTLTLGSSGIIVNSGAGATSFAAPIILGTAQTWSNNASNTLSVSGNVANAGFLLTSGGTGNSTLSGALSGTGGLTKADAGILTLSGVNTFTGNTSVTGGELQLGSAGQLNSGSYAGTITLASGTTLNSNSTAAQTLSGVISGAGSLVKNNTATLTLSNAGNTFAGGTTVNNGVLNVSVSGNQTTSALGVGMPVTINTGGTLRMAATDATGFYNANPNALLINGGTMTSAAGIHHSVGYYGITLNAGTITAEGTGSGSGNYILDGTITTQANAASSVINAPAISLRGQGTANINTFNVADGAAATDLLVSSVLTGAYPIIKTGAGLMEMSAASTFSGTTRVEGGTLKITHNQALQNSTLVWDGLAGTLDYGTRTALFFGGLQGAQNLTMQDSGSTPLALTLGGGNSSGTFTGALLGGTTLTKTGTGVQTLGGASSNTYSGKTILSGTGQLVLSKTGGAIAIPGDIDMAATGTRAILSATQDNQFAAGSVMRFTTTGDTRFELKGTTQTLGGVDNAGITGQTYHSIQHSEFGSPAVVDATSHLILNVSGSNSYFFNTAAGSLRDHSGGVMSLTKTGTGTQTLAGANVTHTGATTLSNGTLALQDTTGFNSTITVSGSAVLNSIRTVAGFASRDNMLGNNVTGSGVLNINHIGPGISGGWTIVGVANGLTMAGTININSGTLSRDNTTVSNINTTATVTVAAGAAFGAGRGGNSTIGALNGAGDVGTFWSGTNAGSITIGNGGGSGTFSGILHGNGTNATDGTLEGGVLSVIKTGTGTQTLSGTNTYTGTTTVNAGRLNVNGSITSHTTVGASGTAATLGGDGTLTGNLTMGANGMLLPGQGGTTDRTLNVTGNVSAVAGANITFNITSEASMDRLIVGGSINLTNFGLVVNMDDTSFTELGLGLGDDFLAAPDTFDLANGSYFKLIAGTTTGMFSNVTDIMDAAELSYYGLSGTQYKTEIEGQSFWLAQGSTYLVAIPEPSSSLLFAMGSLGLTLRRRRTPTDPARDRC